MISQFVSDETFVGLDESLIHLNISENPFVVIDRGFFRHLGSLKVLEMRLILNLNPGNTGSKNSNNNNKKRCSLINKLELGTFNNISNLETLIINSNILPSFHYKSDLIKLKYLSRVEIYEIGQEYQDGDSPKKREIKNTFEVCRKIFPAEARICLMVDGVGGKGRVRVITRINDKKNNKSNFAKFFKKSFYLS